MDKSRNYYEAPATEVVELKYDGFICLSGELDGYGDEIII